MLIRNLQCLSVQFLRLLCPYFFRSSLSSCLPRFLLITFPHVSHPLPSLSFLSLCHRHPAFLYFTYIHDVFTEYVSISLMMNVTLGYCVEDTLVRIVEPRIHEGNVFG